VAGVAIGSWSTCADQVSVVAVPAFRPLWSDAKEPSRTGYETTSVSTTSPALRRERMLEPSNDEEHL